MDSVDVVQPTENPYGRLARRSYLDHRGSCPRALLGSHPHAW